MSIEGQKLSYPGDTATPSQVMELADEYRQSAITLRTLCRPGQPLSSAPFRLVTVQAIELYLNALMLHRGRPAAKIRGLQHNLSSRALFAKNVGLCLRERTLQNLHDLEASREYLVSRYGPELSNKMSELNRLEATLKEVAAKVSSIVRQR